MKNFNFFEKLWEHSRTLRRVGLVLVMCLITLPQVWADQGFWPNGGGYVRFYRSNISADYGCTVNGNSISDFDLGNIDWDGALTITDTWAKVFGGTNTWNSITLYYRVKVRDSNPGTSYSNIGLNWHDNMGGNWDQYWECTSLSIAMPTTGLSAGDYEVEFYFVANGKDGNDYYYSNGSGNYHANFTLRRKITYHDDGATAGTKPDPEYFGGTATVRDNTGLLRRSDGYVFAGWADSKARADAGNIDHEPGQSNMSVTLTADLDLYPVWRPGYYLISLAGSGNAGTKDGTNFIATKALTNGEYEVNGVKFSNNHYVFSGTTTAYNVTYNNNQHILYDTKTDNEDLFIYAKSSSGTANLYYTVIKDGLTCSQETLSVSTTGVVKKIPVAHTKSSRVVIATASTNIKIANIKVVKHGAALPAPLTSGYQISFPGRAGFGSSGTMESITYASSSNLTFGTGNPFEPKSSSHYAQFTTTSAIRLAVTTGNTATFYVCTDKDNKTTTGRTLGGSATTYYVDLPVTNTYYIVSDGSNKVQISKIAFADLVAATAPSAFASTATTSSSVTLSITDGTNSKWEIYYSTSSTAPTASTAATVSNITSKTPTVTGLTTGTDYYMWVRSVADYFNKSSWVALTSNPVTTDTPSCEATAPGSISKGSASGGTGTITLTAAGSAATNNTWYWQSAADGTATNLGSGATKDVSAAGTYYIRSYCSTGSGCWSDAKSVTVVAADLLTPISPTLSYPSTVTVGGSTISPTLTGNTGSGTVSYALNSVSPAGSLTINSTTGVVTGVTASGTATVTATISANGNYAGGSATSSTITVKATPSVSSFTPASGSTIKTGTTITVAGSSSSTVYCLWASSSKTASQIQEGTAGTSGAATVTSAGIASANGTTLYAVATEGGATSSVSSASYTIDDTAPTFVSSVPANSATGVNTSGTIVLTFSEALGSVDGSKFTLTNATKGAVAIDGSDNTKVNIAYSGASYSTTVTLATAAGAVADAAGNTSAALSSISFTTKAEPTLTAISANTLYQAADMATETLTGSEAYWDGGFSSGNYFKTYGSKASSNTAKGQTITSTTVAGQNFTSKAYIEEADNTSSASDPTKGAIEFKTPSKAGKLLVYTVDGSSSNLSIKKKGANTSTTTDATCKVLDVDANTNYFINGAGSKRGIYGIYYDKLPEFSSSDPADGDPDVPVSGTIVLTLDESIADVDGEKFSLSTGSISAVAVDGTDDTKVNITYSGLPGSTEVTLSVAAGAVTDAAGNTSAALSDISFTTENTGYTITFAANGSDGGSAMTNVTDIESGSDVDLAANTWTKTEHYFDGWKTNVALTYVPNGGGDPVNVAVDGIVPNEATIKNVTSNITLTAQWHAKVYNVYFFAGEDASAIDGYTTYEYGEQKAMPTNVIRTGYLFDGWYDNSEYTGDPLTQMPADATGNKYYYAKWHALSSKCLYITGDVITAYNAVAADPGYYMYNDAKYVFGSGYDASASMLVLEAADGRSYVYLDPQVGEVKQVEVHISAIADSNVEGKGISWGFVNDDDDVATVVLTDMDQITSHAFTFRPTDENKQYFVFKSLATTLSIDNICVFYEPQTYTVTYDKGEATGTAPATATYNYNDVVTVEAGTELAKDGYTFRGWFDGTTFYVIGDKFKVTDDVKLDAIWENNSAGSTTILTYFETSNHSSSKGIPDACSYYYYGYPNSSMLASEALTMTATGSATKGASSGADMILDRSSVLNIYANNATAEVPATFGNITAISLNVKRYHKTKYGKISIAVGSTTVVADTSLVNVTSDAYVTWRFDNLANLSGKVVITHLGPGDGVAESSDHKCYLDNIGITTGGSSNPTVSFACRTGFEELDGILPGNIIGVPSGAHIAAPEDPFAIGYAFLGWYDDAACSDGHEVDFETLTITENTTIYAKWENNVHTFTGAAGTTAWETAGNWDAAGIPNSAYPYCYSQVYIKAPAEIAKDTKAHVGRLDIVNDRSSYTVKLTIASGAMLIVYDKVSRITNWSTQERLATIADDIYIGSERDDDAYSWREQGALNGALIMGDYDRETQADSATVQFASLAYTKSSWTTEETAWGERDVNQYIGIPFAHAQVGDYVPYDIYTYTNVYLFEHDRWNNSWSPMYDDDQDMSEFTGYDLICFSLAPDAYTNPKPIFDLKGELASTDEERRIHLREYEGYYFAEENETMLANSWTAPIDIASFEVSDFENAEATIYMFNAGTSADYDGYMEWASSYTVYPGQYTAIPINDLKLHPYQYEGYTTIPSMQSFSVIVIDDGSSTLPQNNSYLTLDYKRLVYDPAVAAAGVTTEPMHAPRRVPTMEEEPLAIMLHVHGMSGMGDRIRILEREDFSYGRDNGWETSKLLGIIEAPSLYAVTEVGDQATVAVPDVEGLGLTFQAGEYDDVYTFNFEYDENEEPLYLLDKKTGIYTRVLTDNTYSFVTTDKNFNERFLLTRNYQMPEVATGLENAAVDSFLNERVQKVLINDMIYILRDGHIYDATGKKIK